MDIKKAQLDPLRHRKQIPAVWMQNKDVKTEKQKQKCKTLISFSFFRKTQNNPKYWPTMTGRDLIAPINVFSQKFLSNKWEVENKTSRKSSNFAFSSKNQSGRIGLKIYS